MYEHVKGDFELIQGDKRIIKLFPQEKIKEIKKKHPKMTQIHIESIQFKVAANFRSGIDTPIMLMS